jgi:hypothetical protein
MKMKIERALLLCARCGNWSGWISRTKGGVKRIDTICSCCGARLKGTPDYFRDRSRQFINAYRPGRGAHNRGQSIKRIIVHDAKVNVKLKASEYNRQNRTIPLETEGGGFETAKARKQREKKERDERAKRG